jgi:hypothetical protein
MTFLARLGSFLAKGIALLSGLGPLVSPLFGSKSGAVVNTVTQDLTSIGSVVVSAEAVLGSGTGPQKLAAAAPLVANIVKTSELVSGHKIANETLFIQGCTDLTNAVVEILNSLDGGAVQSTGQPIPAIPASSASPIPAALAPAKS